MGHFNIGSRNPSPIPLPIPFPRRRHGSSWKRPTPRSEGKKRWPSLPEFLLRYCRGKQPSKVIYLKDFYSSRASPDLILSTISHHITYRGFCCLCNLRGGAEGESKRAPKAHLARKRRRRQGRAGGRRSLHISVMRQSPAIRRWAYLLITMERAHLECMPTLLSA